MIKLLVNSEIYSILEKQYNFNYIYEIRIRYNCPIIINYKGINIVLKDMLGNVVIANKRDIERVISVASNYSLYTVENQIKQAFITAEKGYRIGLSGEIVLDYGMNTIKSIKNVYSVNIRIPHSVINCSYKIFKFIKYNSKINNTLIISPPGIGKTTLLRDITYQFSRDKSDITNVLVIDERYELAGVKDGIPTINIGDTCDIISGCDKDYGFKYGIRSLKPDVIITDELSSYDDFNSVVKAINSGVKIVASIHGDGVEMITKKPEFQSVLNGRYFDRYVVLSLKGGPGFIEGVFDKNFKRIMF